MKTNIEKITISRYDAGRCPQCGESLGTHYRIGAARYAVKKHKKVCEGNPVFKHCRSCEHCLDPLQDYSRCLPCKIVEDTFGKGIEVCLPRQRRVYNETGSCKNWKQRTKDTPMELALKGEK